MVVRPVVAKPSFLRLALVFLMRSDRGLIDCGATGDGEKGLVALECDREHCICRTHRWCPEVVSRSPDWSAATIRVRPIGSRRFPHFRFAPMRATILRHPVASGTISCRRNSTLAT